MSEHGKGGAKPVLRAGELARAHRRITSAVDVSLLGGSEIEFSILRRLVVELDRAVLEGVRGVVVTVGTDAIEEAAAWVACTGPWEIPVVLTGSMLPGKKVGSDGMANLSDAVEVAVDGSVCEPLVVFGGRIFLAYEVVKMSGLERMAFDAPGHGPIGVVLPRGPDWHRSATHWKYTLGRPGLEFPVIPIIVASLGDDGSLIGFGSRISDILVIAGNGAGNLPPPQARAAIHAAGQGKLVVVTSRAPDSRAGPIYGYPGGSATLVDHNVIVVSDLSPHRARIVLSIGHSQGRSLESLGELLTKPKLTDF